MAYTVEISIDQSTHPVKIVLENGLMILQISILDANVLINLLLELIPDKYISLASAGGLIDVQWISSFSFRFDNYSSGIKHSLSTMHARALGELIEKRLFEFSKVEDEKDPYPDPTDSIKKRTNDNLRGVFE